MTQWGRAGLETLLTLATLGASSASPWRRLITLDRAQEANLRNQQAGREERVAARAAKRAKTGKRVP
jgi:hypothetical protein